MVCKFNLKIIMEINSHAPKGYAHMSEFQTFFSIYFLLKCTPVNHFSFNSISRVTTQITLTLCLLGTFACLMSSAVLFSKLSFSKNSFRNTNNVSNRVEPECLAPIQLTSDL